MKKKKEKKKKVEEQKEPKVKREDQFTLEVLEELLVFAEFETTKRVVSIVSWNKKPPVLDIRKWYKRAFGGTKWFPGRGISLRDSVVEEMIDKKILEKGLKKLEEYSKKYSQKKNKEKKKKWQK